MKVLRDLLFPLEALLLLMLFHLLLVHTESFGSGFGALVAAGLADFFLVLGLAFACNFLNCRSGRALGVFLALCLALAMPWLSFYPSIVLICVSAGECL